VTFALKELKRLLSTDATWVGSVVSAQGVLIRVATERGAMTARTVEALAVGDRVLITNGIAANAPVARCVFPV